MLANFKLNVAVVSLSFILTTATITAPFTKMFGKFYKPSKDFVCCKNSKLVVNHYYAVNVFWVQVDEGYTQEKSKTQSKAGCNIICND